MNLLYYFIYKSSLSKELNDTIDTNKELREILLMSALDMKKMFPVRWTNKVFAKFVAIGIKTPELLLHHIAHNILAPILEEHGYFTMNYSTLQILVEASSRFRTGWSHQYGYN